MADAEQYGDPNGMDEPSSPVLTASLVGPQMPERIETIKHQYPQGS